MEENFGYCYKCGKMHKNPIENRRTFDDDIAELLAYAEALENANNENLATVEVLERELYDARRDLELAQAELRIIKLEHELEYHKSAKWDLHPWND